MLSSCFPRFIFESSSFWNVILIHSKENMDPRTYWLRRNVHWSSYDCHLFGCGIWKTEGFKFGCLVWQRICPCFDLSVFSSQIEDIILFLGWSPKCEVWRVGWVEIHSVYTLLIVWSFAIEDCACVGWGISYFKE